MPGSISKTRARRRAYLAFLERPIIGLVKLSVQIAQRTRTHLQLQRRRALPALKDIVRQIPAPHVRRVRRDKPLLALAVLVRNVRLGNIEETVIQMQHPAKYVQVASTRVRLVKPYVCHVYQGSPRQAPTALAVTIAMWTHFQMRQSLNHALHVLQGRLQKAERVLPHVSSALQGGTETIALSAHQATIVVQMMRPQVVQGAMLESTRVKRVQPYA